MLRNFAVLAVFESQLEPWFTGARVTTCATILRREKDENKRRSNIIRFVQLRSLMSTVFPPQQDESERQASAESLRVRIEGTTTDTIEPHWRVRVVRQGDLWDAGVRNALIVGRTADSGDTANDEPSKLAKSSGVQDTYYGCKWGVYLRAPDLYWELTRRFAERFAPFSVVASIWNGIKSGEDHFFFVRDVTQSHLSQYKSPNDFKSRWGILPFQTDNVRIVRAGDGTDHLIGAGSWNPMSTI